MEIAIRGVSQSLPVSGRCLQNAQYFISTGGVPNVLFTGAFLETCFLQKAFSDSFNRLLPVNMCTMRHFVTKQ